MILVVVIPVEIVILQLQSAFICRSNAKVKRTRKMFHMDIEFLLTHICLFSVYNDNVHLVIRGFSVHKTKLVCSFWGWTMKCDGSDDNRRIKDFWLKFLMVSWHEHGISCHIVVTNISAKTRPKMYKLSVLVRLLLLCVV